MIVVPEPEWSAVPSDRTHRHLQCTRGLPRPCEARAESVRTRAKTVCSSNCATYGRAEVRPVTQCRCRCGRGRPSPGADVAGADPSSRTVPSRGSAPLTRAAEGSSARRPVVLAAVHSIPSMYQTPRSLAKCAKRSLAFRPSPSRGTTRSFKGAPVAILCKPTQLIETDVFSQMQVRFSRC